MSLSHIANFTLACIANKGGRGRGRKRSQTNPWILKTAHLAFHARVHTLLVRFHSGAPAAEGRQAEPHTHIRELKGTHEMIFSCVPWLAVLLVGAYARRRRRRWSRATWRPYSSNRLIETMQPWFNVYFFDIGQPCYDQLTPVKIRYLLTIIMWPYRGLKSTTHRGHVFFQSWPLTKWGLLIGSRAHVRLTCLKPGRIVWKPANASPGLKCIQIITFSSILLFAAAALFYVYKIQNRKPHRKVTKLKSKFYIFPGLA